MQSHANDKTQLICTTHETFIMDQDLLRRDEIWFTSKDPDSNNASAVYSLDKFKERYDKKLNKAYLEGRYGAIPFLVLNEHNTNRVFSLSDLPKLSYRL